MSAAEILTGCHCEVEKKGTLNENREKRCAVFCFHLKDRILNKKTVPELMMRSLGTAMIKMDGDV